MNWVRACLKNRLLIYLAAIAICLFGLFSLYKAPLVPFTGGNADNILINISYPGANAQTIYQQVLKQLIPNLQQVNHIQTVNSVASSGFSQVILTPNDNITPTELMQSEMKTMQVVSSANLPSSIPTPQIILIGGGMSSLITYQITSNKISIFDMNNFIQSTLNPKFSAIPGVITFTSSDDPEISIALNPTKITQYQLDPSTIAQTINTNAQYNPLGNLFINQQDYPLNIENNIKTLYNFKHMLVGYTNPPQNTSQNTINYFQGTPIYLNDIANVSFRPTPSAYQIYSNFNGIPDTYIELVTRNNANPLTVSKTTQQFVNSIKDNLPGDMKITPTFDMAKVVNNSIEEVVWTILIACVLVVIVAFVFLGRLKTTFISIIAIPICLLGAITIIYLLGYTINILTLLALVIAVGLVVDDAIVVVENITRYVEMGYKRYEAVVEGTYSIALTVIGITLTLLAVYLPLTFIHSDIINTIKPFAVTLAGAVFISGIVALTVTPVVSYTLISDQKENRYQQWFNHILSIIINAYHAVLSRLLRFGKTSLLFIVIFLAIGTYFVLKLPMQVYPADPDGYLDIFVKSTPTSTLNSIKQRLKEFAPFYKSKKIDHYIENISPNEMTNAQLLQGRITIQYKDKYLKQVQQFTNNINAFIAKHHIANAHAVMQHFFNLRGNGDISFTLYQPGSTEQVNEAAEHLAKALKHSPVFETVSAELPPIKKQLAFDIEQEKALSVGISKSDIMELLSTYYGGYRLHNDFSIAGLTVPVRVSIDLKDMHNPKSIDKLMIHSNLTQKDYPLSEFVHVKLIAAPSVMEQLNGFPAVDIDLNLNPGHAIGEGIKTINKVFKQVTPNAQLLYKDAAKQYLEGSGQTIWITLLGLFCIYFLLTILFRNLIDPFIILLTVPCTVIGGALSLYFIGGTLNIYSTLGLITLIGLITKHGILIVRFANDELNNGKTVNEAVLLATKHRFRPIMMTTFAMVMGALPLLLSDKIIYVSRQNLAIVIIGGLLIGTIFSLVIIPIVYSLIKRAEQMTHLDHSTR